MLRQSTLLICVSLLLPAVIHFFSFFVVLNEFQITLGWLALTIVQIIILKKVQSPLPATKTKSWSLIAALLVIVLLHFPYDGLQNPRTDALFLLRLLIIAPIFEELSFRLIPLQKYRSALQIVLTSSWFSIYHFKLGTLEFFSFSGFQHFAFGIALAVIFLKSRRVMAAVIVHSAANLIGLFLK